MVISGNIQWEGSGFYFQQIGEAVNIDRRRQFIPD
jgi:hypothetical protein